MYMHPILFSFSLLFSTAFLLSADKPQVDKDKPIDTLQSLCEQVILSNVVPFCDGAQYNSTRSKTIVQCVQNKIVHVQPEYMSAHINQYPLVMQLELLDATHEYNGGNDDERKNFFARLATFPDGCAMLNSILDEVGRLHAEKLEQSIEIDPETGRKKISVEDDVTWKLFPYRVHMWNKRTPIGCVSVEEVELSSTQIMAPPVYINLFCSFKSEIDAPAHVLLPVKTIKIIDWQNFDAVSEWACDAEIDGCLRQVRVYRGEEKYSYYPCDPELGNSFGDAIAHCFKLYNYARQKLVTQEPGVATYFENNPRTEISKLSLLRSAQTQAPRTLEWVCRKVAAKLEAEMETASKNS